ncbi:hypothetical protein B4168_1552 [Anoxybacillus flavithermus]|nr:hypothetical protein B4168_1552 [Anoxybacillus flavithermus]OAO84207.1 hypothetical protein GT23_3742 [Parageobacillus thermoglucosidasius]
MMNVTKITFKISKCDMMFIEKNNHYCFFVFKRQEAFLLTFH